MLSRFARTADEQALLRACLANLESNDSTPFGAYADWLDEHDSPDRAAVLRAMTTSESMRDHPLLTTAQNVSLDAKSALNSWRSIGGLVRGQRGLYLVRGLPVGWNHTISMGAFRFNIRRQGWRLLRYVSLMSPTAVDLVDLATNADGPYLAGIALRFYNPTTEHPTASFTYANWPNLQSLILEGQNFSEPVIRTLGAWRGLGKLTRFHLQTSLSSPARATQIFESLTEVAWQHVHLADCLRTEADGEAMIRHHYPHLRSLTMRMHLPSIFPGDRLTHLTANAPQLRELHLEFCAIDDAAIVSMLPEIAPRLQRLTLDLNPLSETPGDIFRQCPMPKLNWLGLRAMHFSDITLQSIINSPLPEQMTLRIIQHQGQISEAMRERLEARFGVVECEK